MPRKFWMVTVPAVWEAVAVTPGESPTVIPKTSAPAAPMAGAPSLTMALSVDPGTCVGFQLPGVFQLPPPLTFQKTLPPARAVRGNAATADAKIRSDWRLLHANVLAAQEFETFFAKCFIAFLQFVPNPKRE